MDAYAAQPASPPVPAGNLASVDLVIECLRGLAALWVFLFHIADAIQEAIPALYPLAREGYRGVPVFFAISGYCIFAAAQGAMRRNSGAQMFLLRRLKRIYPTFWASIIVVMAMPFVLEGISSLKSGALVTPRPAWADYSLLNWFGVITLSKELIDGLVGAKDAFVGINTVYWSLAIEVQFYLVVFVAIVARRYWAIVLGAVSLLSVYAMASGTLQPPGLFLNLWPGFLCGVLVRLAHSRGMTPLRYFGRRQLWMSVVLVIALAAGATTIANLGEIGFFGSALIAAMLIWCLGGIEDAMKRQSPSPMLRRIGNAALVPVVLLGQSSYSLYLLHGKVHQLPEMFVRQLVPTTSPAYVIAILLVTCLVCHGFYLLVERRFQNHRLPQATRHIAPSAVAASSSAA